MVNLIKVLVFAYIKHPNPTMDVNDVASPLLNEQGNPVELMMPIRWKQMEIRINLNTADPYLEDFSEIGGPDYISLPCPYYGSTPIISGIRENSNSYKSVQNTATGAKFDQDELFQYTLVKRAAKNDELAAEVASLKTQINN